MSTHSKAISKITSGFTLIEVLIAVLVLSIGLLGLASLQATSLKNNYSAYMRSQAAILANDIADRIRSNPGAPSGTGGALNGSYNNVPGLVTGSTDCEATTCSSTQLAAYNLEQWSSQIAATLPGGDGTVTGNGSLFTVTVMWDDEKRGVIGKNCSGDLKVDLACFSLTFVL